MKAKDIRPRIVFVVDYINKDGEFILGALMKNLDNYHITYNIIEKSDTLIVVKTDNTTLFIATKENQALIKCSDYKYDKSSSSVMKKPYMNFDKKLASSLTSQTEVWDLIKSIEWE